MPIWTRHETRHETRNETRQETIWTYTGVWGLCRIPCLVQLHMHITRPHTCGVEPLRGWPHAGHKLIVLGPISQVEGLEGVLAVVKSLVRWQGAAIVRQQAERSNTHHPFRDARQHACRAACNLMACRAACNLMACRAACKLMACRAACNLKACRAACNLMACTHVLH